MIFLNHLTNKGPILFHLTERMIVPKISFLGHHYHPSDITMSGPEKGTMRTHIEESLSSGIIHPYTFPVRAELIFVEKKDKTLRPCIDYRGLNQITKKVPLTMSCFSALTASFSFNYSLNLTFLMHATWSESKREMTGKQRSR